MDHKRFGKLKRGKLSPSTDRLAWNDPGRRASTIDRVHFRSHADGKRLVLVITGKGKKKDRAGRSLCAMVFASSGASLAWDRAFKPDCYAGCAISSKSWRWWRVLRLSVERGNRKVAARSGSTISADTTRKESP